MLESGLCRGNGFHGQTDARGWYTFRRRGLPGTPVCLAGLIGAGDCRAVTEKAEVGGGKPSSIAQPGSA